MWWRLINDPHEAPEAFETPDESRDETPAAFEVPKGLQDLSKISKTPLPREPIETPDRELEEAHRQATEPILARPAITKLVAWKGAPGKTS